MGKRPVEDAGGGEWLNTYADMVTLLLTFFVLMLSMSTVNQEKFNAFIESFSTLPKDVIQELIGDGENLTTTEGAEELQPESGAPEGDINELYESLKEYIEQNNQMGAVEISMVEDVIYIRFSSALFFKPDQAQLLETSYPTLTFIGDGLKDTESQIRTINICGHTASTGDENYKVNSWVLSGERAAEVAKFFDDTSDIDPKKIMVLGYGNEYPVVENNSAENRAKNRRVELVIVGNNSSVDFNAYSMLEDLYKKQSDAAAAGAGGTSGSTTSNTTAPAEPAQQTPPQTTGDSASILPETIDRVERDVSPYED